MVTIFVFAFFVGKGKVTFSAISSQRSCSYVIFTECFLKTPPPLSADIFQVIVGGSLASFIMSVFASLDHTNTLYFNLFKMFNQDMWP